MLADELYALRSAQVLPSPPTFAGKSVEQITRGAIVGKSRGEAVRVGVDLAKRVIQVHAVDAAGQVLTSRALARDKFMAWCAQLPAGCNVAMETSSSAHHWARKLIALGLDARVIAHATRRHRTTGMKNPFKIRHLRGDS